MVAALLGVAAIGFIHFGNRGQVHAQEEDVIPEDDGPPVDEAGVEATAADMIHPFEPHAADEGAVSYDSLGDDEKLRSDRIQEWAETDHGEQVHEGWAEGSLWAREHAKRVIAERVAGLEGAEEVGVD